MSIIKKMRKQKAVWWARSATPDQYGAYSFVTPVEIDCRWDDSNEEFRDSKGETLISKSTVYVDRVVGLGDRLRLGELVFDILEDPMQMSDAFEVASFQRIPNLKATETLFIALLV